MNIKELYDIFLQHPIITTDSRDVPKGSIFFALKGENFNGNAYAKAATDNGKVKSASVTIKTAICPECGRTYVSGGTTHTQIKYYNEENPYQKELKSADRAKYSGMNADYSL